MLIGTFSLYFILFVFIFSSPNLRKKFKYKSFLLIIIIPALLSLIMVVLDFIKVYFIYKFLVLLFIGTVAFLTYLEWGKGNKQKRE